MKRKINWHEPYGLRARFGLSLLFSGILCALVFCVLYFTSGYILSEHFANSDFEEDRLRRQAESLQDYIEDMEMTGRNDLYLLEKWERRQPLVLLELYAGDSCIYSSFYHDEDAEVLTVYRDEDMDTLTMMGETSLSGRNNAFPIRIGHETVTAVLYSDHTYQFYVWRTVLSFAAALALFIFLFLLGTRRLIGYVCKLNGEVQILEGGNLGYEVSVQGNDEITDLAKSMNRMRASLREQMETEQQLYEASRKLITEMSHDLRTPLTGLMLYTEILRSHRFDTEAQMMDYLEKIDAKAHHIKQLSDHLFEYTLGGGCPKLCEPVSLEQALSAGLANMLCELKTGGFRVCTELDWPLCLVQVKKAYIDRILENISSNITKYAEPAADIQIETICTDTYCGLSFMNACAVPTADIQSTGIGLESIRSMMKQMDGLCTVEQTESAFEISILFPRQ